MIKTDLATAIGATIFGVLVSFFVCNLFIGPIEDVAVKTVDSNINADLVDPDKEIFNYKALNPTVEVYVGSCIEYNANGECIEILEDEDIIEEDNLPEENSNTEENSGTENEAEENSEKDQNNNTEESNTENNQENT